MLVKTDASHHDRPTGQQSVSELLTWVGLQRLAMPLPNAPAVAVALVSDTMHKLLPGIADLVKCPGL